MTHKHVSMYPYRKPKADQPEYKVWADSERDNKVCSRALDNLLFRAAEQDAELTVGDLEPAIAAHGIDRVQWVLASTIRVRGREFARTDSKWARSIVPLEQRKEMEPYAMHANASQVAKLMSFARTRYDALGLLDESSCREQGAEESLEGKILVLHPTFLSDNYKTPDWQLVLATGGFGCAPQAMGQYISGVYIKDGEVSDFRLGYFIGPIKEELIPQWCTDKLQEMKAAQEGGDQAMCQ